MTASAAATGFLSLPPGPLHTPQRLSLNSINDHSSFPFTAAYQRRAGTSLGCLVMLWWLVQASGTFQPQLCLRPAVPRCPHAHRCQDTQSPDQWAPRAVSTEHGGGLSPRSSPKTLGGSRPCLTLPCCPAPSSSEATGREQGSDAVWGRVTYSASLCSCLTEKRPLDHRVNGESVWSAHLENVVPRASFVLTARAWLWQRGPPQRDQEAKPACP